MSNQSLPKFSRNSIVADFSAVLTDEALELLCEGAKTVFGDSGKGCSKSGRSDKDNSTRVYALIFSRKLKI